MINNRQQLKKLDTKTLTNFACVLGEMLPVYVKRYKRLPTEVEAWIDVFPPSTFANALTLATMKDSPTTPTHTVAIESVLDSHHAMLLGGTGDGKTTIAKYLCSKANNPVLVLDPHATPTQWGGAKVVGAGVQYDAIATEIERLIKLMEDRYAARNRGVETFAPLIVIVDEFPAISSALGKDFVANFKRLIREARKVSIKLILCTQGAEVKTLGIAGEGSLRDSITIVRLGKFATDYARSKKLTLDTTKRMAIVGDEPCVIPDIGDVKIKSMAMPMDY